MLRRGWNVDGPGRGSIGRRSVVLSGAVAVLALGFAGGVAAIVTDASDLANIAAVDMAPQLVRCDDAVNGRDFIEIFDCGDEIFGAMFNDVDGVGANVGDGGRFTKVPRADLNGPGQWLNHQPPRAVGPESSSCMSCHFQGGGDGSAPSALNSIRDPLRLGNTGRFIQRQPPHLFMPGALQILAEEMTTALDQDVKRAIADACSGNTRVQRPLESKGIRFGSVEVVPGASCPAQVNVSPEGIDKDLVVKPFGWKGNVASLRVFNRFAATFEIGLQTIEDVGMGVDGDFDGVVNELGVKDVSALTVYLAAQPRPTTRIELSRLRLAFEAAGMKAMADDLGVPPVLTRTELASILRGDQMFRAIGCATCHVPALRVTDARFREPSALPAFRDAVFPSGLDPVKAGVDPANPLIADLTRDPPDNVFKIGNRTIAIGPLESDGRGGAVVRLFSDLKRHDLGGGIAESIDETGSGASVFITQELWGVGSTPEYLHDGRAPTLKAAILEHGGEADASRQAFRKLMRSQEADLIAFLKNLVLFFPAEE
jgi:hypothetical protein